MKNFILISGSLRKDSYNTGLLKVAAEILKTKDVSTRLVAPAELAVPLVNADEAGTHFPESIKKLGAEIQQAAGVLIATPEYNGSISPVLKNFIDWTSMLKPHPWKNKATFMMGTSPGDFGAVRGLWHSRIPLDKLGAHVHPDMYALPHGDKIIQGTKLNDEVQQKLLTSLMDQFVKFSHSLAS